MERTQKIIASLFAQSGFVEMPTAYHMVHYRKVIYGHTAEDSNFTTRCRKALSATDARKVPLWERAADRVCNLNNDDQIMLSRVADLSSALFGELILTQQGGLQAIVELKGKKQQLSNITLAEVYSLQERKAPVGSDFVRGIAYWLLIDDHLLFIKTQSMTSEHLAKYLTWMNFGSISENQISLQAEFDKSQVGGDIGDIRSLQVTGQSAAPIVVDTLEDELKPTIVKTARKVADRFAEFTQAGPILKALLGLEQAQSLVESLGPKEYVAVSASVKVRGTRTSESRAKLKALANDLADMTDAKVQVQGKDGDVRDGDAILRTRMPFNVPHAGSNLLEYDNVADQLQEVYSRFVQDGKLPHK